MLWDGMFQNPCSCLIDLLCSPLTCREREVKSVCLSALLANTSKTVKRWSVLFSYFVCQPSVMVTSGRASLFQTHWKGNGNAPVRLVFQVSFKGQSHAAEVCLVSPCCLFYSWFLPAGPIGREGCWWAQGDGTLPWLCGLLAV